ncbi:hypothetical protein NKR19_g6565 [Coniochaeta hoffmannii]|uniref:Uncharacterized protein n=1 Tax=Coniochaeta hoffmannii TaxID=91930 RepID=A0AA38RBZ8_9PEZI|nr:hypothetical protein NKR19_g6565 [Coniochaeta hoffmannii]
MARKHGRLVDWTGGKEKAKFVTVPISDANNGWRQHCNLGRFQTQGSQALPNWAHRNRVLRRPSTPPPKPST